MIDTSFLKEIEKLRLTMKRRINTKYYGERQSLDTGVGTIFKDFKSYVPGDDFRRIDWKIYARSNELFVRRYEEERNFVTHILLDSSASMNFRFLGQETKFFYAAKIALGLIYLAIKSNEKYRFATFSDQINMTRYNAPFLDILEHISDVNISGVSSLEFAPYYKKFLNSKSLIFLISDFLMPQNQVIEFLKLFKKHQIFLVQVLDKAEKELSLRGSVIIEDLETNAALKTYLGSRMIQEYENRLRDHIKVIKNACAQQKANFIETETSSPVVDFFYKIINELENY
jgi:uncharacterized protein (DUF58 family)